MSENGNIYFLTDDEREAALWAIRLGTPDLRGAAEQRCKRPAQQHHTSAEQP